MEICAHCDEEASNLCGRCMGAAYCDSTCQRGHYASHAEVCFDHKDPDPQQLKMLLGAVIDMQDDSEDKQLGMELMAGLINEPHNRDWVDATAIYVQPDVSLVEAGKWDKMRAKEYEQQADEYYDKRKNSKGFFKKAKLYAQEKRAQAIAAKKRARVLKKKRQKAESQEYQDYRARKGK